MSDNKKRDDVVQLLRDSIVPKSRTSPVIQVNKLVVVVPGPSAVEVLTAIREALKDPE